MFSVSVTRTHVAPTLRGTCLGALSAAIVTCGGPGHAAGVSTTALHPQEPSVSVNILMEGCGEPGSRVPTMFASGDGGAVSTVIENLLSRKQKLVEQLEKAQSVEDRDKIEHQLEQINTALDFLDRPESKDAR